jgi:hypothetical protein
MNNNKENNQIKNNNNGSEMNKVNTNKIVSSDAEEILKLARQQKAEYEQERLE